MLSMIEQRLPDLSRTEQRIARWVLQHPRQAATSKLAAIAEACDASEPSVIRFCRHVGTTGFREFTIKLTESLSRPAVFVHRDVGRDDSTVDAVAKVMDASIRALVNVRATASSMPFDSVLDALQSARQLTFIGLGASGHVAADASHKFFRLGIPCTAVTDMPTALQRAAIATRDDVVIIISRSGSSAELDRVAQLARNLGATVVAVTDPDSTLARSAAVLFPCDEPGDSSVYTPMSSRLAHLAVLDALQTALALALGDRALENLKATMAALPR